MGIDLAVKPGEKRLGHKMGEENYIFRFEIGKGNSRRFV